MLVAQSLRRIPVAPERDDLARQIITAAEDLPFALECLRWLRTSHEDGGEERLLSETMEDDLGRLLANRIATSASAAPLYRCHPCDAPRLYLTWRKHDSTGEVASHLKRRFDTEPAELDAFLDSFVGTAWGRRVRSTQ